LNRSLGSRISLIKSSSVLSSKHRALSLSTYIHRRVTYSR
jgi:hypothetical protein